MKFVGRSYGCSVWNYVCYSGTSSVHGRHLTKDWKSLGTFHARDERSVQTFPVQDVAMFSKYLRVDMQAHYGTEHFCPLTVLRLTSPHYNNNNTISKHTTIWRPFIRDNLVNRYQNCQKHNLDIPLLLFSDSLQAFPGLPLYLLGLILGRTWGCTYTSFNSPNSGCDNKPVVNCNCWSLLTHFSDCMTTCRPAAAIQTRARLSTAMQLWVF